MKTNLRLATAACATVVALGMVGCGGGGAPATPPPAPPAIEGVPAYATPVDVNETKAKKVLSFMDNGGFIAHVAADAQPLALKTASIKFKGPKYLSIFWELFDSFLYIGGGMDKGYPVEKVAMAPTETDSGELNITMDCAYDGSFTLDKEWKFTEDESACCSGEETMYIKVTFDNCIHSGPLLEDIMHHLDAPDDYKFAYSGSIEATMTGKEVNGVAEMSYFAFDAKNLTEKITNNTINEFAFDMNAKANIKMEGTDSLMRFAFDMDGVMNAEEFDENGTSDYKEAFEIKALAVEFENMDSGDLRKNNFTMDGYMSMAETNSSGDVSQSYIYGKDIVVDSVRDSSPALGHITSNTFGGTLGLPCLSGAVDIATTTTWETNSTQDDLAGNTGRTPFVGTTTISGANDTVATVSFHQNSATPKASYGSISIDGVTVDYDTLGDMTENCDMTLINP